MPKGRSSSNIAYRVLNLVLGLSAALTFAAVAPSFGAAVGGFRNEVPRPSAELRHYVKSRDDFRLSMFSHRMRCLLLAEEAVKFYGEELGLEPSDLPLIREFIGHHDDSKLNESSAFIEKYYDGASTPASTSSHQQFLLDQLYSLYGKNRSELPPSSSRIFDLSTQIDKRVAEDFFLARGLYSPGRGFSVKAKAILSLEKIVDVTDRGRAQTFAEEFHREPAPVSVFLATDLEISIAQYLSSIYGEVTRGFQFTDFKNHPSLEESCENVLRGTGASRK